MIYFAAGTSCATFDVMINSSYLKKCQKIKPFMVFTILVILSGVSEKFDKKLDTENYVILKNRTVRIHGKQIYCNRLSEVS